MSFERVFEVLDLPVDIKEPEEPQPLDKVEGHLAFEQVSFKYPDDTEGLLSEVYRPSSSEQVVEGMLTETGLTMNLVIPEGKSQAREMALEEISFEIRPRQLVALVGPSGSGKTTLTYLVPRLYDPTSGVIKLEGKDLRTLSLKELSEAVGMVT